MEARAVARWGRRHALRQPLIGCVAGVLILLIPLGRALSPFPELGLDPTRSLLQGWTPPVAWLGAGLALLFLSRHGAFLELLPASGRRLAEFETLLLAPLALQGCLGLGALWTSPIIGAADLGAWGLSSLLVDLHVASIGLLVLRVPADGPRRVACLWALLWGIPALLGGSWVAACCAPVQGLGPLQLPEDLPRALLATLLASLVFLLPAFLIEIRPQRARLEVR